ncbi:MAG: DUF488 family protein [Thermaerobacter sp.]|nr:DUF488 family protein [Thermaerobacter sp.]
MHGLTIGRTGTETDSDIYRILVDRLWPRGVVKTRRSWDAWFKDLAPTSDLRKWYGHEPERYTEFRRRYWVELEQHRAGPAMLQLLSIWHEQPIMLVTATKNVDLSHVPVLRDFLWHIMD